MASMSTVHEDVKPVLTITEAARATVADALAEEAGSESLALWLEISGETDGVLL